MCGVVALSGEGVVSAESVADVRCGVCENAVIFVLVDEFEGAACLTLEDGVKHDRSFRS